MGPRLIKASSILHFEQTKTSAERLWRCYDTYVDDKGDAIIHSIVHDTPLLGLSRSAVENKITHGQFILHTALIVEGQVSNGGIHQLLTNFPGQVEDIALMLGTMQQTEFLKSYLAVANPMIERLKVARSRATQFDNETMADTFSRTVRDELNSPPDAMHDAIDHHFRFVFEDRLKPGKWGVLPEGSWAISMADAVVDYVVENSGEFVVL